MGTVICWNLLCPYITSDSRCLKNTSLRIDENGDCEVFTNATSIRCSRTECKHNKALRCVNKSLKIDSKGTCDMYEEKPKDIEKEGR